MPKGVLKARVLRVGFTTEPTTIPTRVIRGARRIDIIDGLGRAHRLVPEQAPQVDVPGVGAPRRTQKLDAQGKPRPNRPRL